MVPAGTKAKHLSSVNHTTKTIHLHLHHHQKQITKNIFRVAVADLKLGAASKHFETLLSLLACCDTDIGNIGHSRKNMDSMIYCMEKVINRKTAESLSMPLPSTCNAIENNFSSDILSRLCGVAADRPYEASGFRNQLYEMLFIPEIHKDLALPITWDPAHLLNLGVTDVRDSKSESAEFFRLFIKRCNVFNHILSHGKGFSFLQMLEEPSLRPVKS